MGQFIIEMYKQGDIVIVKFPFTDGSQFKKRPALIISNSKINSSEDFLLVQITSKINNDGLSLDINKEGCLQELPLKSYIRLHKIFTIHKSLILSKISEVNQTFIKAATYKICELIAVS
jgi:mRNA interferase MazF